VQEVDAAVGAIMDSVRADPALDTSTLTFFTSDNGAPSNHALNQTAPTLNETANGVGSNYPLRGFKGSTCPGNNGIQKSLVLKRTIGRSRYF
jgi:arylsulfatase A-like enzyme